ncbi:MAG: type III pantothenate kinase [Clostridiales bacterium]|nr:type III pantothenate kinase [Clostridiales bacterium]
MILAADIGNSNITLGVFRDDDLLFESRLATDRLRTGDQYAIELLDVFRLNGLDDPKFAGAIIGSVVPELTNIFADAVEKATARTPMIIGAGLKTGLNIKVDNPAGLGADLVAGAVGAIAKYPLPCLVMDLGTATKISVIDQNGAFLGCTISAGISISLDALSARTSQLPSVSLEAPKRVIGTNSADCMQSGTVLGTAAMLDGLSDMIEAELGQTVKSRVATGGLAKDIVACCKKKVSFNKYLILEGLLIIYRKNA